MTHKLLCPKPFGPAAFMGDSWFAAEIDDRAERLPDIDASTITLVTFPKTNEEMPTGEHCLKLLKDTPYVRLGGRAFLALWEDQSAIPEPWKEPLRFVCFDGLILRHQNDNRYSLYLSWHHDQWHWYAGWLGNTRSASHSSAVLAG